MRADDVEERGEAPLTRATLGDELRRTLREEGLIALPAFYASHAVERLPADPYAERLVIAGLAFGRRSSTLTADDMTADVHRGLVVALQACDARGYPADNAEALLVRACEAQGIRGPLVREAVLCATIGTPVVSTTEWLEAVARVRLLARRRRALTHTRALTTLLSTDATTDALDAAIEATLDALRVQLTPDA